MLGGWRSELGAWSSEFGARRLELRTWSVELGDCRLELRTVLGGCKWELGVGSLKVGALSLEFGVGSICEMIRSRLSIVAFASRERNFIFEAVCSCATTDACSKNRQDEVDWQE